MWHAPVATGSLVTAETENALDEVAELPVVGALRSLSIFSADQSGAYREHYATVAIALGRDIPTKLTRHAESWARSSQPGTLILTGNAGTGKTAVAEAFCRVSGGRLPGSDLPSEIAPGRLVVKDLSGIAESERPAALLVAVNFGARGSQALVCANEGVLRDCVTQEPSLIGLDPLLDRALRQGAVAEAPITIVNVNRQRPTADGLWDALIDYVSRKELWHGGCGGCPYSAGGCPMRSNSEALRRRDVRDALQALMRLAGGDAVPTMRETLAILAWATVGGQECREVKSRADFTANKTSYYSRLFGAGLRQEDVERSPLLLGLRRSGLGSVSDLQVDGWLRDDSDAPSSVMRASGGEPTASVGGDRDHTPPSSRDPRSRVYTATGTMTFHDLGEALSTSEDSDLVDQVLASLAEGEDEDTPGALSLWRRRVFFEASPALGGHDGACARLLEYRHLPELIHLAHRVATGEDLAVALQEIARGLNFLVSGFPSATEGLLVPDTASLFARNPGSYRPAMPSLVHATIPLRRLHLEVPDRGLVEQLLDVDHVDVLLLVDDDEDLELRIRPPMYEAIREAASFRGPVAGGIAEMNDLRSFYGRLADREREPLQDLRVADPDAVPPALIPVTLPHFAGVRFPDGRVGGGRRATAGFQDDEVTEQRFADYEDLRDLEGRQVRISTRAEELVGVLERYADNAIILRIRRHGRRITVPVWRSDFQSVALVRRTRRAAR